MSDQKIFTEKPIPPGGRLNIDDEFWTYYLKTVRRVNPPAQLEVAGPDRVGTATLKEFDPLELEISETRPTDKFSFELTLFQGLTKKQKFEETIKRGTELGVTRFVPLITKRTVRVPNNLDKQLKRWKKIAMDSARISERDTRPDIRKPLPLKELEWSSEPSVYLGDAEGQSADELFSKKTDESGLIVGPEGGFTEEERNYLLDHAESSLRVGNRNLRSETASITLICTWLTVTKNYE